MEQHTRYTKVMLIVIAILLLGGSIVGFGVMNAKRSAELGSNTTKQEVSPTAIPTRFPHPINGIMELRLEKGLDNPLQGKPFRVELVATSGKSKIAGYDVVMTYDKTVFERQLVENKDTSFRIYPFDREDRLSISATKQLESRSITEFEETPILSFTFVARKKGKFTFSLRPLGQESSKFVDETAQATYPNYKDLVLEIR